LRNLIFKLPGEGSAIAHRGSGKVMLISNSVVQNNSGMICWMKWGGDEGGWREWWWKIRYLVERETRLRVIRARNPPIIMRNDSKSTGSWSPLIKIVSQEF
jgi:hypothetical protein